MRWFGGYGVMRKLGSSVGCPLTRRYVTEGVVKYDQFKYEPSNRQSVQVFGSVWLVVNSYRMLYVQLILYKLQQRIY